MTCAQRAAEFINKTPYDRYPKWRCHRTDAVNRWWVTCWKKPFAITDERYRTDAELIELAKTLGWTPEGETQ
jgi:hypothetical protein